jgi:hypothetical protein
MAQVRLWLNPRENAVYDLPRVCMKCGAEARHFTKKQFSWYPPWVWLLLLCTIWPFIIATLILTKRKTVEVPMCDKHRYHFLIRILAGGGVFSFMLVVGFVLMGLVGDDNGPRNGADNLAPFACMGWMVLLLGFVLGFGIYNQLTTIRPTSITDREITLTNVSPVFVRAVEEDDAALERDVDRAVEERWQRRRRGERRPDDERYERGDDRPPHRPTDITEREED